MLSEDITFSAVSKGTHYLTLSLPEAISSKFQKGQILEYHPNDDILVFIGKLSTRAFQWIPTCYGFTGFWRSWVFWNSEKIVTGSERVKSMECSLHYYNLNNVYVQSKHIFSNIKIFFKDLTDGNLFFISVKQQLK